MRLISARTSQDCPDGSVTGSEELAFQLAFTRLTPGRQDLWLKAGWAFSPVAMGDVGLAAVTAGTVGALSEVFARYPDFTFSLDEARAALDDSGHLTVDLRLDDLPSELWEFNACRHLGSSLRMLRDLWGPGEAPVEAIELPLRVLSVERRYIGNVPVRLGSRMRWIWAVDGPSSVLPTRNELLHRHYVALCDDRYSELHREVPVESLVREAIATVAGKGTIDHVARGTHVSVRTLQRQLRSQNLSYRQLQREAQLREAKRLLLATSLQIADISRRLGYEKPKHFSAAFRAWTGEAPSHWRAAGGDTDVASHRPPVS
jgi:AraC-like DNA-binding protein